MGVVSVVGRSNDFEIFRCAQDDRPVAQDDRPVAQDERPVAQDERPVAQDGALWVQGVQLETSSLPF